MIGRKRMWKLETMVTGMLGGFVATKVISHGRVTGRSVAPQGWVDTFAERVRDAVLPGFSAFSLDDARRAIEQCISLYKQALETTPSDRSSKQNLIVTYGNLADLKRYGNGGIGVDL